MSRNNSTLTQARLRELLSYDPETGVFTWRITRNKCKAMCSAGCVAGALRPDGYISIGIDFDIHMAHRLVWLYISGEWPTDQLDHINGNRSDNRLKNLREATSAINNQNRRTISDSKKGVGRLGVNWRPEKGKYRATIQSKGISMHIGYFDSEEAAHSAYLDAKRRIHPGCTI